MSAGDTRPALVLVGPPGAGKTTVGLAVAEAVGLTFRDTDADVEATVGKTVADIFLDDGEPVFRDHEHAAVATALTEHPGVLALGGGAVLHPDTRDALRGHRVVFLDVGLADAASRVGLNRDRPLLFGNPRARLKELLDSRRSRYTEVATAVVVTTHHTVAEVVEEVLTHVR